MDKWLNYHLLSNYCIHKKILRIHDSVQDEPMPALRRQDSLKSDKAFVIEGVRQSAFADDKVYKQ